MKKSKIEKENEKILINIRSIYNEKSKQKNNYINTYISGNEEKLTQKSYYRMICKKNPIEEKAKQQAFFPFLLIIMIMIVFFAVCGLFIAIKKPKTIVFDFGEDFAQIESPYYSDGSVTVENPEYTGYYVENFYNTKDFKEVILIGDIRQEYKIDTIYARWLPVQYSIKYSLNGGINNLKNLKTYTIESNEIILYHPTRNGYTFIGWYETSDFSDAAVSSIPGGSTENKRFYAKWQPNNIE